MTRRLLTVAAAGLAAAAVLAPAAPALAEPPVGVPDVRDCHEMNAFLHLQNVRSCDPPPTE